MGTIVPRDVSHLITLIKRLLNDNNINLLQCGFKIMQNLSKGLKKHFGGVCRSVLGLVFGRLKDNKQMIVDETM